MAATIHAAVPVRRTTDLPEVVTEGLAPGHPLRGAVLALGNFDGFHLGHQALIRTARRMAGGRPVAVMSCEPHPRSFFGGKDAPFRLATPSAKRRELARYGVDFLYSPRFDHAFAGLGPREFVERILVEALGVRHVIAGPDFRFGHRRAGDMALLAALGAARDLDVAIAPEVTHAGVRISSTLVRAAIEAGDLRGAAHLLGHGWLVETERTPDGGMRLHPTLCRPPEGRYLGRADGPGGPGGQIPIDIGSDGTFRPLGPRPVGDEPQMWRLDGQAARGKAGRTLPAI